jgi:uncharacterized protein
MIEARRTKYRVNVVNDLRSVCRKYGFKADVVGGIYYLQRRLARLVAESLVTGLFWLNLLFVVIAWVVARSVRGALAMIASLTLVPLSMLGGIGWFHVPVDIISAPATNVCIGIAIDSMIHLVFGVRRAQRDGKKGWEAWVAGHQEQWRGIVLFGRNYRRRLRHFRVVGFSTDATFRSRRSRGMHHRHPGKSIRVAAARWCTIEKARLRRRLRCIF